MIRPEDIERAAGRKSNENMRFRRFLKMNADPDKLDEQFKELHKELFSEYDCSKCRNCCRMLGCCIDGREIRGMSGSLGMTPKEFKDKYLTENRDDPDTYLSRSVPCVFLNEDGSCLLGDDKPEDCRDYPYTMRPDRMGSLLAILDNAAVCPVVFEMLDRLKRIYRFR